MYPYIGLALALRQGGHEPVLALPGLYRDIVEREDLSFVAMRPNVSIDDRELVGRIMDPAQGPQVLFRQLLVPSLPDSYADLVAAVEGADLLVTHPAALAGPIVAQERRMPWISTVLAPMSFFSITDPVVPPPAPWLQPLLARSRTLSRAFRWITDRMTQAWSEPVQQFRVSRGLPRGANPILDGQHSPHLVLAMFSRVLATPQADWPPNVRVVGASLYNASDHLELPAELLRFLDTGPPPIVFTLGTSAVNAAGSFYDVSARVAERLQQRAVLLVGPHAENRPAKLGPNVHLADFAPHATLFPRASVVVHQGGAGTLHQAMASGRPMLVVPYSHDQPDNAARASRLGIARTLYPREYTVDRVARELRTVLDARYAERAALVADAMRAENGAQEAAAAIDAVLTGAK